MHTDPKRKNAEEQKISILEQIYMDLVYITRYLSDLGLNLEQQV